MTMKHFHQVHAAVWLLLGLLYLLTPEPIRISGDDPSIWPILGPQKLSASLPVMSNACLATVPISQGSSAMAVYVPCTTGTVTSSTWSSVSTVPATTTTIGVR
jgi:hypothetical protein